MDFLEKLSKRKALLLLSIIGCVVYFAVFLNGFVGDDAEQIYNFTLVYSIADLPKVFLFHHVVLGVKDSILGAYYKPLMLFYFYLIRAIFGLNPFFYHAPQVILIIINSFLVYLLFTKFFKKYIAFLLAALFLVHPINQETAAYASNIQDVLFFFFGMSALLVCFRQKLTHKSLLVIGSLLLLSLLSKESGILFLAITPLYLFLFTPEENPDLLRAGMSSGKKTSSLGKTPVARPEKMLFKKGFLKKIFFTEALVLVFYFLLRFSSHTTNAFWIEPPPMAAVSLVQRALHIPLIIFYYVQTFFYPNVLAFNQQWIIKKFDFQTFFLPLFIDIGILLFLFGVLIKTYKKKLKGRITLLFFLLWFLFGLFPHLQIIPLDATVATRWFYFSSVGLIGIIGFFYALAESKYKNRVNIIFIVSILILCVLLFRTIVRNAQWQNAFVLYSTDSNISQSALLENNLGDEYFKKGDYKNAYIHFKKALILNPNLWIAINNLGTIEEKKGNLSGAMRLYQKAYKKADRLPVSENIARILLLSGQKQNAENFTKQKLLEYPLSAKLWLTLALSLSEEGKYSDALSPAQKSYNLSPDPKTQTVIQAIQEKIK